VADGRTSGPGRASAPVPEFGVETIELDLPPLVGALGQRLRDAGVPVTPERSAAFARALVLTSPKSRSRLYWTARAIFVSDRAHAAAFDSVYRQVFGEPAPTQLADAPDGPTAPTPPDERPHSERPDATRNAPERDPRVRAASVRSRPGEGEEREAAELVASIASDEERLAGKSFDSLDPDELAALYRLMSRLDLATPLRRTRRFERARHGRRVDLRRTLRASLRTGGDPIEIAHRRRRVRRRSLVMLCDISGSMEPYARAYLQFLSCAAGTGGRTEAFAFATRLTRLTTAFATRRPEQAMQRAAATAPDWSSGTRIGEALKQFNDRYGRRGMARGAVVVILSDGWERGDPAVVGREMERLARLAHKIVWVNPRLSAREFSIGAAGMRAALRHCDALVSGHSFEALGEVVDAIAAPPGVNPLPASIEAEASAEQEEESWPSATPVPGSSVAMPSGHGPSRGRTTPGWEAP
jgi:uncharacterized protein with von Willebrand factor type A (vWA) domain